MKDIEERLDVIEKKLDSILEYIKVIKNKNNNSRDFVPTKDIVKVTKEYEKKLKDWKESIKDSIEEKQ